VWIAIGLATATFLVYAQVWRFGFVNFDDPDYVNTSGRGVVWAFTSVDAANWFPAGSHAGRHSRARRGGHRPFRSRPARTQPDYAEAHYNLGVALAETPERLREAIAHLEAAQRLHPDAELARTIQRLKSGK
jgi:hypothetical protein